MTPRMTWRILLAVGSALGHFAVPLGVMALVLLIGAGLFGGWFGLALAVVIAGAVVQELNWLSLAEWARLEGRSRRPAGAPAPPAELALYQVVAVIGQQVIAVLLFGPLMDGGRHFRAAGLAYLLYAAGALVILWTRWRRWTTGELLLLKWGWVPALVAGVPCLVPAMRASGPF